MANLKVSDRGKPWVRKPIKRDISTKRKLKNIFLIYCEGQNTEPEYFRSFPVNTETLVEAIGLGRSRTALVQRILEIAGSKELLPGQRNHDPDRQIWAVFDFDTHGIAEETDDFDQAVRLATANGLRVAYSNDSFELWLFLHDHYVEGRLHRTHYYEHLSASFGFNYAKEGKGREFCQSLYNIYLSRQGRAIQHAIKLTEFHRNEQRPSRQNPCTTVHLLVTELNTCLKT